MRRVVLLAMAVELMSAAAASARERALGLSGDAGLGALGEQAAATVQTGIDLREGPFAMGVFGRVRLLMQEGEPLHSRDWDEASDYLHLLRYMRYAREFGDETLRLELQAGELLGYTLGHGTLLRDYNNIADPDHPHTGVLLEAAGRRWRSSLLLDNVLSPAVVAGRFALQPWRRVPALAVGGSVVVDPQAPESIRLDENGEREVNSAYRLVAERAPLFLVGLDIEYRLGEAPGRVLIPYLDVNTSIRGVGLHVGASGETPLSKTRARLLGQVEYRVGSSSYAAAHVETFYDLERYQACLSCTSGADERAPKLAELERGHYGGHGMLAQAGLRLADLLQLKLGGSYRPGPDSVTLWGQVTASPLARLQLGVFLLLHGLDSAAGVMALAESRVRLTNTFYALGQYVRSWSLASEIRYYQPLQSCNIGLGAAWSG